MDLREYYRKIRAVEAEIGEEAVVVVCAGVMTEVPKALAARLIAERKAELAAPEEAARFRAEAEKRWKTASGLRKA